MDKAYVQTDKIALAPTNNVSKDVANIKCRGEVSHSNSFGSVRSRYLREPTGSCHNVCKYGGKHESGHDEKSLTFRRFMANRIALETVEILVKGPNAVDRKERMVSNMKPSGTTKALELNIQPDKVGASDNSVGMNMLTPSSKHQRTISSPQFILTEDWKCHTGLFANGIELSDGSMNVILESHSQTNRSMESFEKKIFPTQVEDDKKDQIQFKDIVESKNNVKIDSGALLLGSKSIEISPQVILPEVLDDETIHASFLNSSKSKSKVNEPKASSMLKPTPVKNNILKQKNSPASTEADSGDNTNIFEENVLSNLKEVTTSTALEVIKQKKIAIRKQSESPKLQSNNQNASFPSRKANSLNVRIPLMRSIPELNTSRSMNGRVNREEKSLNSNEMTEVGELKLLKPKGTYISSTITDRSSVSFKTRKSRKHAILEKSGKAKDDSCNFDEKILKVIEPRNGKALEPLEKLSKELDGRASNSAVGEAGERSNGKNQRKFKRVASKEEDKRRARRTPAVQQPADSSSSPYKLKFKKGKVIELQTADSVGARRLKFRRGRVLGENPSGEVAKRSFRRKRDIGNSNEHKPDARAFMLKKANLESKAGILKYQDALGYKEKRALFNHVIEETASKLAETSKSKVKALVGAFETVISLQEA